MTSAEERRSGPAWKRTVLVSCLILLGGAGLTAVVFSTEPEAVREGATRETAMLVQVAPAERGTYRPTIVALGTVVPERDVVLSPRVGGEIVEYSPSFTPGGFVREGQTLVRVDPSDYRNALAQRESELRQALADLEVEMGRQEVARRDYQLLDEALSGEREALVLRQPQLDAARARVAAAKASVEQARLELRRTKVTAPFDALVLDREVDVGSQVTPGSALGRLVGLEAYWVETTVPLSKLRWLSFPGPSGAAASDVRIRDREAWPEGTHRTGRLHALIGALEERTRMARVLVSVRDPLAREAGSRDQPALMIGAFVEAAIRAEELRDVVRLDRDHLRKSDTVWIMKDSRLDVREVEVVFRDAEYAYVRSGLSEGELVVTSNLSTVVPGAPLREKEREQDRHDGAGDGQARREPAR